MKVFGVLIVCFLGLLCSGRCVDGEDSDLPLAQDAYVKASFNSGRHNQFGYSIAISGNTMVVGAIGETGLASGVNGDEQDEDPDPSLGSGAAYVFFRQNNMWVQQAYLKASNPGARDHFGWSVAISGNTIVVGAEAEGGINDELPFSGAAYVFVRDGVTWSQQAYLKASNAERSDRFGRSVGIWGDTIVVGASAESGGTSSVDGDQSDNSKFQSGAAYVFAREGSTWTQQSYLKASDSERGDSFGRAVAVSEDTIVVGAIHASTNDTGGVYVFAREGNTWTQSARLGPFLLLNGDAFGSSVAIWEDAIVVGDPSRTSFNRERGAAYVFGRDGSTWSPRTALEASNPDTVGFGTSVAIHDDSIAVGAPFESGIVTGAGANSGVVYSFGRDQAGRWSQTDFVRASNAGTRDYFGVSVGMFEDTVVAGARGELSRATGVNGDEGDNSGGLVGAAYVFSPAKLRAITSVTPMLTGGTKITIQNVGGRVVGLEFSPDLTVGSWIELGNFFQDGQTLCFHDQDRFRLERGIGFYRAFLRPLSPR